MEQGRQRRWGMLLLAGLLSLGLGHARLLAQAQTGAQPSEVRSFALPGKTWSLVLDLPGFVLGGKETTPDARGIMTTGRNSRSGLTISIYLQKANEEGDSRVCRDFYWSTA